MLPNPSATGLTDAMMKATVWPWHVQNARDAPSHSEWWQIRVMPVGGSSGVHVLEADTLFTLVT